MKHSIPAIALLAGSLLVHPLIGTPRPAQQLDSVGTLLAAPPPHPLSDAPWSSNVQVNDDAGTAAQKDCRLAVDSSGNSYALWTDHRNGEGEWDKPDVYFSFRPARGSWGPNERVNDDSGTAADQYATSIAVGPSGNAYALWMDNRNGNWDIYFSLRPLGGSWGGNVRVNDDGGVANQTAASIAVDSSGNAYAVWGDGRDGNSDIYFSYRPAGDSWGASVRVNDDAGTQGQHWPSIGVDPSGNAYVVWTDGRSGGSDIYDDIYFSYRPSGGTWGDNVRVNHDAGPARQDMASIAVDASGNAYAVWVDWRNGDPDIYSCYRASGAAWESNDSRVNLGTGTVEQWSPSVDVDPSGNAFAVYDHRSEGSDVYFSYRSSGGSWEPGVKVNDSAEWACCPRIAVDVSGNAYAVWLDGRDDIDDIYFSYRPAGGPSPVALSYVGPLFLPTSAVMVDEVDGRINMGDHVHLRLPFTNNGSQTLSNATVSMTGGQYTGSSAGVSIHNGSNWANQQNVQLTPATIGPGGTGIADFWMYVTDNDPIDRQSLSGQTWLQVRTATGQWTIRIALSPVSFGISGNEALKSGSCLHNPDNFEIQKYAQYAAGAWTMASPPTNDGDPDTPEHAVKNLVSRVNSEFAYENMVTFEPRWADTELLTRRYGEIGVCRHYADLTTGLLRSLGLPSRNVVAALWNSADGTAGHGWVESYLNTGSWRQADSTSGSALYESVYEDNGWTVKEAWADKYPLSSTSSLYTRSFRCASQCYTEPVNAVNCALCRVASAIPNVPPDLSCVEDVTSRYHHVSLAELGAGAGGELGIQIQAPTFVTRTLPFSADASLSNQSGAALGPITATVSVSDTVHSTDALFEVSPTYQVVTNLDAGETVTVTWTITPLVSGSGIPLRVSAYGGDLFAFDEKPLVVNDPGTLPNLTLEGVCGLETVLPGEAVALAAYVLDENLQAISDVGTVVTATVYATPTVQFTTTVDLPYSETSGMYEEDVSLLGSAPIGSYQVDLVATHSGYDPATATTFFSVRPPLTMTVETNVGTLPAHDTLTMTVDVWDRGAAVTEAGVWAEITTPRGVITAPLTVGTGDTYTLSFLPFDLRADLGGQVPAGNWVLDVTVDYQGSEASAQRPITVRPTGCMPLLLKKY